MIGHAAMVTSCFEHVQLVKSHAASMLARRFLVGWLVYHTYNRMWLFDSCHLTAIEKPCMYARFDCPGTLSPYTPLCFSRG